jgi:hypothetical protein
MGQHVFQKMAFQSVKTWIKNISRIISIISWHSSSPHSQQLPLFYYDRWWKYRIIHTHALSQNACNEWPLHVFPLFKSVIHFSSATLAYSSPYRKVPPAQTVTGYIIVWDIPVAPYTPKDRYRRYSNSFISIISLSSC